MTARSLFRLAGAFVLGLAAPLTLRAQWALTAVSTRAEFRGLSVVGDSVAWASGTHGTVARTADAGATWTVYTVPGADSLDLRSIVGLGPDVAVAASAGAAERGQARIFRTADAGRTWTEVYATREPGVFLDALAFWDARHGIAQSDPVDGTFFLIATGDGGRTWTRIASAALPRTLPGEAAFAASGACLVVRGTGDVWIGTGGGARARVFHSPDRGRSWSVYETPVLANTSAAGIFALAFRDARRGVAVGGEYTQPHLAAVNVAVTDDGGRTWRAARGPLVPAYLSGVDYDSAAREFVAVGLAGTAVSRDGGESWIATDTLAFNAVRFGPGGFGVAAGPDGRLARWTAAPGR